MSILKDNIERIIGKFSPPIETAKFTPKYRNIFSFYGVKAGLGVSSFIAQTAFALANEGYSVGILDLNFDMPMVANFFTETPSSASIHRIVKNNYATVTDVVLEQTKFKNLKIYTASPVDSLTVKEYWDTGFEGIEHIIQEFSLMVDVLLIDLPSDLNYEGLHVGLYSSYKVYSFCEPTPFFIRQLISTKNQLDNMGDFIYKHPQAINDIIFTNAIDEVASVAEMQKYGLNLIGVLPFDLMLKTRFSALVVSELGNKGNEKTYRLAIETVCNNIKETVGGPSNVS